MITAKHTHYEITDYYLGDCPMLEYDLSTTETISTGRRKWIATEKYFDYQADTHVLYVPRGYDINKLVRYTGQTVYIDDTCNSPAVCHYTITTPPLNNFQREAIRFLSGKEEYKWTMPYSQLVLSIPTRSGKTYCTIVAGALLEKKLLIIVKSIDLRDQWIDDIINYTGLSNSDIGLLDSSATIEKCRTKLSRKLKNNCVYLTTVQTMHSYLKRYSPEMLNEAIDKLGIGIKVFDEAHKEFRNILKIDYALNVWKTFYITATFGRSAYTENAVFQKCFDKVAMMKKRNEEQRKHTIYLAIMFCSRLNPMEEMNIFQGTRFNRFEYIDYELRERPSLLLENMSKIIDTIIIKGKMDGKILILSSSKASCDAFYDFMKQKLPDYSCCVHYDGNKQENFRDYGVICATPQMLGTGMTIPGLRFILNTEPTSSKINVVQYAGRLAEYAPDKDTYYIEFIDKAFSKMEKWYKYRKSALSPLIKKAIVFDNTIMR